MGVDNYVSRRPHKPPLYTRKKSVGGRVSFFLVDSGSWGEILKADFPGFGVRVILAGVEFYQVLGRRAGSAKGAVVAVAVVSRL